eukprot:sb/3464501/
MRFCLYCGFPLSLSLFLSLSLSLTLSLPSLPVFSKFRIPLLTQALSHFHYLNSKPTSPPPQDDTMMFATHTRENRDKWLFTLNKCASNDSLESFRSNSINGSTITLNTVEKIRDVREEERVAEYKAHLREKTHLFQWTRRYCFVARECLFVTSSDDTLEPICEVPLLSINVKPDPELKKPFAFRLSSERLGRDLLLAAESQCEYETWLKIFTDRAVPASILALNKPKITRVEVAPPVAASRMKELAHTTGLLFRLVDRNWVCSWCARHHSNLLLYDTENSAHPFRSIKLSGCEVLTDTYRSDHVFRFLITPGNKTEALTLGTENHQEFEKWLASFRSATSVRSAKECIAEDDLRKSGDRLENSNQSLPAERFTSGYGSGDSLNSIGSGVYENTKSNRNSTDYEDYVNTETASHHMLPLTMVTILVTNMSSPRRLRSGLIVSTDTFPLRDQRKQLHLLRT